MTGKERIILALNHKSTDVIPYEASFTMQMQEKLVKYYNETTFANRFNIPMIGGQYCGYPSSIEGCPEFFRDDFGVVWNRSGADKDIGVVENYLITDSCMGGYRFPNINRPKLCDDIEAIIACGHDKFTFFGIGFSMFERAWSLYGMENLLMDMICEPDFVHKLLDAICEYNLKVLDIILEYPLDGIYFGDDWGQQKGLIMGPKLWRAFIKPRMKRMYEKCKSKGKYILQHSCGDIYEIYPDLIEIGLDCHQTFQPEIFDIVKVKEEFGDKLCFWGGISTQQLLHNGTVDEVKSETARIMKIMGKSGGYIAAPTHAVPNDVSPENIDAMFDVFLNQSEYAIV